MVRVPPCHGGCCGFESRLSRHFFCFISRRLPHLAASLIPVTYGGGSFAPCKTRKTSRYLAKTVGWLGRRAGRLTGDWSLSGILPLFKTVCNCRLLIFSRFYICTAAKINLKAVVRISLYQVRCRGAKTTFSLLFSQQCSYRIGKVEEKMLM